MISLASKISWHHLNVKSNLFLCEQSKPIADYHDFIVWLSNFWLIARPVAFEMQIELTFNTHKYKTVI